MAKRREPPLLSGVSTGTVHSYSRYLSVNGTVRKDKLAVENVSRFTTASKNRDSNLSTISVSTSPEFPKAMIDTMLAVSLVCSHFALKARRGSASTVEKRHPPTSECIPRTLLAFRQAPPFLGFVHGIYPTAIVATHHRGTTTTTIRLARLLPFLVRKHQEQVLILLRVHQRHLLSNTTV